MTSTDDSPLHGVSLSRYAAVQAAIGEGFDRDAALAVEGFDPFTFERAAAKWTARLAEAASRANGLLARYQAELAAAEDWLSRGVSPLDSDLGAWVAFYGAYTGAADPVELLRRLRLGTNDVARLSRRWRRRLEQDPSLGARIASLPLRGEVPAITADPPVLRRSRRGGAAAAAAAEASRAPVNGRAQASSTPLDVATFGLERYAQLTAELAVFPAEAERVRRKFALDSVVDHLALANAFRAHFGADPAGEREFARRVEHYEDRAREVAQRTTPEERARLLEPAAPEAAAPAALPSFMRNREAGPLLEVGKDYLAPEGLAPSPPGDIAPSPLFAPESLARSPAHEAPSPPLATAGSAGFSPPPAARKPKPSGAPQAIPAFFSAAPLPFAVHEPEPKTERLAGDRPLLPPLPFVPVPPSPRPSPLPFAPVPPPRPSPLPFAPVPPPRPSPPALTLEQYASLLVDLARAPAARADTLARYHLNEASKSHLDAGWSARGAADPALRVKLDEAKEAYRAWLSGGRP